MATDSFPTAALSEDHDIFKEMDGWARAILKPIASLRLTVVLFFLAVLLIFLSTLAQAQAGMNMVKVIEDYFRSYIVMVDLSVLFVPSWFPELHKKVAAMELAFPLPGGFTIGVAMAFNLLAAHLVRFKIQAKGPLLVMGAATLAVGTFITYWVIVSGHNADGLQGRPPFAWSTLWIGVRVALFALAVGSGVGLVAGGSSSIGKRILLFALALTFGGLGFWASSVMLDEASLRILWQLIQGGMSGLILLLGCLLVFKRRAGIVLLHAGIGLMMFSEFFVSQYAVEGQMRIGEGETVNFLRDIREVELAIIDDSKAETDDVIVVPGSRLLPKKSLFGGTSDEKVLVTDPSLPFDIHIEEYMQNSDLIEIAAGAEHYANEGAGKQVLAKEVRAGSGADGGDIDLASAYVDIRKKGTTESLGRYLLSQNLSSQGVEVDGKKYGLSLRFKHDYKPYRVSLVDVRKDDYVGTNTPMNYSSDIVLTKAEQKVGDFHIWMNNPLRYSGETFYQSGYFSSPETGEITTLQVVANTGWMMPYIGCMLVAVGMAAHFCGGLWRFLEKKLSEELTGFEAKPNWIEIAIPFVLVLLFGGYALSKFRPPSDTKANMKIHEFGKLPVAFQGRVKPLDTLARNTLRVVSGRETFVAGRPDPSVKRPKKLPAIQWMLDVVSGSPEARKHRVYRIDSLDVLATLGLQRRKRFRYALEEFSDKIPKLQEELKKVNKLEPEDMSLYQRKLLELEKRIRAARMLEAAFLPIPLPAMPTEEEFATDRQEALERMQMIGKFMQNAERMQAALMRMEPPLAVPVTEKKDNADLAETDWQPFANAWGTAYLARFSETAEVPDATLLWSRMLSAYGTTNVNDFNEAVFEYQRALESETPSTKNAKGESELVDLKKLRFEHFFNSSQPFMSCLVMYVAAFVLVCCGWLAASFGKFTVLNRSAYWMILFTFGLHTFALWSRVYISGRPPITNLYSSAVFIGWAAVLLGLLLEFFYKRGLGNALSAIAGFATLLIAYALAADGDTFTVLRAVLDTQFWLATHVVCITLGYSTTFVAGLLGILYILSMAYKRPDLGKALTSMTYGTLCFAIFFSFVGTVLGGLWADDSWGRFWGWDPKENGALMIVLWNALVLHARWGGMIRQRGIAILAILGNVVTAWSWFGVNELGVGLHSYGFTEGVLMYLGMFVLSQILIIGFGLATMRGDRPTPSAL